MLDLATIPQDAGLQDATRFATRDRVGHTDMVLDVACKDAIARFRDGRPDEALSRLHGAGERAERVLGPTDWSTRCGGAS